MENIKWITVNGVHIPIRPGEDKDEAVKEFFAGKYEDDLKRYKVYRGNNPSKSSSISLYGEGTYYTDSKDSAKIYAGESGEISENEITLKNPLIINSKEMTLDDFVIKNFKENVTKELPDYFNTFHPISDLPKGLSTKIVKDKGYDGVIVNFGKEKYYIVF